jgi:N-acetylmuramoyl-L-alanine amidase
MHRRLIFSLTLIALLAVPGAARAASGYTKHHTATPYIVVLDPGHGGAMHYGDESGAPSADGTLLEKTMTLVVATQAATDLRKMGYRVYLTRTRDQPVNTPPHDWNGDGKIDKVDEYSARNVFANRHHADVFVSIHFDGSSDPSVRGTHGYYCPDRPFWRGNQRLANLLTNSVVSHLQKAGYPDVNGGVATDVSDPVPQEWPDYPWFLVLGPSRRRRVVGTAMPGALIETLFMSSPRDDTAMHNSRMVAAMARGYADGIRQYFNGRIDR